MTVRFGIEHEFSVSRSGAPVDFRTLIHDLPIDGRRLDPSDTHAHRLSSGVMLTCDGEEAEVATPPLSLAPGASVAMQTWTSHAAQELRSVVPPDFDLLGGSTHVSISVPDAVVTRAAGLFSRTFAPALMLLLDRSDSPGMLVRPRFGRLELGGEYATGDQLAAVLAMAAGGALVCTEVAARTRRKSALPPPVRVAIEPAVLRYGWYLDRNAFGIDLYAADRSTLLRREMVGRISVGEMLAAAWAAARAALTEHVASADLAAADQVVAGKGPLPAGRSVEGALDLGGPRPDRHGLGRILDTSDRGAFSIEPVVATWDFTVLRATGDRQVFLTVPAADSDDFADELDAGALDSLIAERLARPSNGSKLRTYAGAMQRAVYDEMVAPQLLAVPERGPGGQLTVEG